GITMTLLPIQLWWEFRVDFICISPYIFCCFSVIKFSVAAEFFRSSLFGPSPFVPWKKLLPFLMF
ncbi:MAG: hypothetical protein AAGA67_13560, partial [Cyanobacteria bacterium P01_F01_bin.153]